MTTRVNRRWVLAKRPIGEPTEDCFELQELPVPELVTGDVLVEVQCLSLDPYMRGRMRDGKSYAEPLKIGEVITGESAGVVIEAKSDLWSVGDTLTVHQGWQSLIAVAGNSPALLPADTKLAPLSAWLGVLGMPGRTAYFGLQRVGKPKAGETLVVSAAFRGLLAGKNFGKQLVRIAG